MKTLHDHLATAVSYIDQAMRHRDDAIDAFDTDDEAAFRTAHAHLKRCLREARSAIDRCRSALGDTTGLSGGAGAGTNADVGVGGVPPGGGTSGAAGGRMPGSPLLYGDIDGWLDRAEIARRRPW